MKVKIGPHADWFGPYQLAELLCFWVKEQEGEYGIKSKPHWVHQFGEWLAHGSVEPEPRVGDVTSWNHDRPDTVLSKFLSWIHSRQQRKIKVKIDPWDTWNMDHTLALIVLPMLRQLKEKQHGGVVVLATTVGATVKQVAQWINADDVRRHGGEVFGDCGDTECQPILVKQHA